MASSASSEQCTFTGGSPSKASMTALFVTSSASCTVLPFTSTVAIELVAIAAPQPKVLNFASRMTLFSSMSRYTRMMSPHTALPTVPQPLAFSISPTFWGLVKCSITLSE